MASSRQDIDELEVAPDRKVIVTPSECPYVVSLRAVPAGGKGDFERVVADSEEEHPRGEIGGSTLGRRPLTRVAIGEKVVHEALLGHTGLDSPNRCHGGRRILTSVRDGCDTDTACGIIDGAIRQPSYRVVWPTLPCSSTETRERGSCSGGWRYRR